MIRFFSLLVSLVFMQQASAKPNILFLFTDDQRADCLGALGHPVVKTPQIDTLVKRGFVFDNAFCLGSNSPAVCSPSRNMLLSGRAYFRWKGQQLAPADGPNLPVSMKAAGYETYHLGKKGNTATAIQATFEHNHYLANDDAERRSGNPGAECADGAIKFLNTERDKTRPFFMYLAFGNPHDPKVATPEYLSLYQRDQIPLPKNYAPQHPFRNGSETIRDELLAPWPRTEEVIRQHLHEYYAVMSCLDANIGRVLVTLREQGLEQDTIIVYSSDHGLALGSHGLMGKQNVYDDGYRAPLIFAGPGIPQGRSAAQCYLMDIFPTICDLAGATLPAGLDAQSLLPVISGKKQQHREALFLSYQDSQKALRLPDWKLIRYPLVDQTQLFDLLADPHETRNLAAEPAQRKRVQDMLLQLAKLQKEFGDEAPLTVATPEPAAFIPPIGDDLERLMNPPKKAAKAKKPQGS
jgi:arylsulfatase A-like enzyme